LITLQGNTLPEPCVVTIGKFESIHRGHQAGIKRVVQLTKEKQIKSAVVAFSPHPHNVLSSATYSPLFTRAERAFLLAQLGVDYLLEFPFDVVLMQMSATQFCNILFMQMQAEAIVVGDGFQFGHGRTGTIELLNKTAMKYGRTVHVMPPLSDDTAPISTSAVRTLLGHHMPDMEQATRLLGFPFFAVGTVTQGRQLGRTMGFPTLNLYPPADKFLPRYGVYATRTFINGQSFNSITNIGQRPTVNIHAVAPTIETHLLETTKKPPNKDGIPFDLLYGVEIRVDFLKFIRAEMKFDGLDSLKNQIATDIKQVKNFYTIKSARVSTP